MFKAIFCTLLVASTLTGCVSNGPKKKSDNATYLDSGYKGVAATYLDKKGALAIKNDNLEQLLVGGKALHDAGYWAQSAEAFERAEKKLAWKADSVDTPEEIAKLFGTTITNDTLASYNGKIYEGVMLDYYQSLNYLMLGDEATSRVRFNRLKERQSNAETQLRKYTESLKKSVKNDGKDKNNDNKKIIARAQNEKGDALNRGKQSLPSGVKAGEIRNPAGDLLGALFRSTSSSGSDKMGNTINGMIESASSKAVSPEARKFTLTLDTEMKRADKDHIYVIYEDGTGPSLNEFRVDLPVYLVSKDVLYSGIALPEFKRGTSAQSNLTVASSTSAAQLVAVADMNRIAALEFDANYQGKVSKAVSSAIIKTIAQAAINRKIDKESDSPLASLFMKAAVAVGQAALTKADTRSWYNLPNTISLGVMQRGTADQVRIMNTAGEPLALIDLPLDKGDVLIYVRQAINNGELKSYVRTLPANTFAAN